MDTISLIKIISALIYPVGMMATFLVMYFLFKWLEIQRLARLCGTCGLIVFVLSTNPLVAKWLAAELEQQYPQQRLVDIVQHDGIIVLGGGVRIPLPPAQHTQIGNGSDRFWYAARLYHANKAPKIVIAGGNVFAQSGMQGEAFYAKQLLVEWGVPNHAIVLESNSRTTAENTQAMKRLLATHEIESALLVTSALHMPRAYGLFKSLPIPITPASADVIIRNSQQPSVLNLIPSASALRLSTVALHEYYGGWFNHMSKALKALMPNGS